MIKVLVSGKAQTWSASVTHPETQDVFFFQGVSKEEVLGKIILIAPELFNIALFEVEQ